MGTSVPSIEPLDEVNPDVLISLVERPEPSTPRGFHSSLDWWDSLVETSSDLADELVLCVDPLPHRPVVS